MNNRSSIIWLIIFLCGIVFGLGWLVINGRYVQKVNLLDGEIKKLNQQLEEIKNKKVEGIKSLEEKITTSSAGVKNKISTESGEKVNKDD